MKINLKSVVTSGLIAGLVISLSAIPDDIFFDDDSSAALTYSVQLSDGKPIPAWITFDPATRTFSGTPAETAEYTIIVTAADKANAKGFGMLKLSVSNN